MEGPPSDATLLIGVAERDIGAFRALYERHAGWLALRLARRCNDRDLVADAVQDTFVAVWRGARRWDGRGEVAAWVWGIGIRRLIDQLRSAPRPTEEIPASWAGAEPSAEERVLVGVE